MNLNLQYKIYQDTKQHQFLRENSYWYKYLNRSEKYYKSFLDDMKDKYKLKPIDKLTKISNDLDMIRTFLDVLK